VNQHPRLERIKPILVCPACQGGLHYDAEKATCLQCACSYQVKNGKIYFVEVPERSDNLDELKGRLKQRLGKYYYMIGRDILAPTYPFNYRKKVLQYFQPAKQIVIDVGCGNYRLDENIFCLDMFDYNAVDIVCDLTRLPFKPDRVDGFISRSVLEHVQMPFRIVDQFYQCTKAGGLGIHLIPFLFPFHASPHDYQRFTHEGQKILFKNWEVVEQTNPTGPVTLCLLCLIEFLSALLSGKSGRLKAYIYLFLCGVLFPLKYLDVLFIDRPKFLSIAPSILSVVRKGEALAIT